MDITSYSSKVANTQFFHLDCGVMYVFGTLFIILGIVILFFHPRAKRNADDYRKRQMIEFKKNNPKGTSDYDKTGMYLPAWERVKQFAPGLFSITFFLIGLAFLLGTPLHLFG